MPPGTRAEGAPPPDPSDSPASPGVTAGGKSRDVILTNTRHYGTYQTLRYTQATRYTRHYGT